MADLPVAFHDLPPEALPFTVEFHKAPPDESPGPVKTFTVTGAGALHIPGFGWPTWVRVRYADGTVYDAAPPTEDPRTETARLHLPALRAHLTASGRRRRRRFRTKAEADSSATENNIARSREPSAELTRYETYRLT